MALTQFKKLYEAHLRVFEGMTKAIGERHQMAKNGRRAAMCELPIFPTLELLIDPRVHANSLFACAVKDMHSRPIGLLHSIWPIRTPVLSDTRPRVTPKRPASRSTIHKFAVCRIHFSASRASLWPQSLSSFGIDVESLQIWLGHGSLMSGGMVFQLPKGR